MRVSTPKLQTLIHAAAATIAEHVDEVTALDQAIGDGDHVVNLQRGLAALAALPGDWAGPDWAAAFQKIGMTLMSSVGGASGSLYGTFFLALAKRCKDITEINLPVFAEAFAGAVEAMKQRGKADLGDKTMLDVFIPVAARLRAMTADPPPWAELLRSIDETAAAGCESTRDLLAGKGRAAFLGERARGQLDPGARTAQLMITAINAALTQPAA